MDQMVLAAQQWLNSTYKDKAGYTKIEENGKTGWPTMGALTQALQLEIGIINTSTSFGSTTLQEIAKYCPISTSSKTKENIVKIIQAALYCKGYGPGGITGVYSPGTQTAITSVQKDLGCTADGTVTPKLFKALLTMDAYVLLSGGSSKIRSIQQWLNKKYINRAGFFYMPCDGYYSRDVQKALMYAIQYEEGLDDATANGRFGPTTQELIKKVVLKEGSMGSFVYLLQAALIFNGYDVPFDGNFSSFMTTQLKQFQAFSLLNANGTSDFQTWASLLVSTGDPSRAGKACDCITEITPERAKTLVAAGYETVGRYLTNAPGGTLNKNIKPGEIETILKAGLSIFPIYQTDGRSKDYFNSTQGANDAVSAYKAATAYGFQKNTTIYFAVDFDALGADIQNNILPHFQAINNKMKELGGYYKIGVYGPRNVCIQVSDKGYAKTSFVSGMSTGFSGNLGYPLPQNWAFDQISTVTKGSGAGLIEIDNNIKSGRDNGFKIPVEELNGYECIVVSAKEGDDRGFKYNFIETAIKRIKDLPHEHPIPNLKITWIIEASLYSKKDLENFSETARKLGVEILFITNKQQLINYINTGSIDGGGIRLLKIKDFTWFGHGHKGYVDFGPTYEPKEAEEYSYHLHKIDIDKIRTGAFALQNFTHFYSCNTGTQIDGSSFAQLWANKTKGITTACTDGQTSYYYITICRDTDQINHAVEFALATKNRLLKGYSEEGSLRYPELGNKEPERGNPNPHWVDFKPNA
ncbi:glycoside hydrolase domain-containing protein [Ectobacillus panaciterrae]|uniref:glycoside hydrolase domain-containing protein n=1 Tax=Ectobacillus panaciterrae TaxID=363872 RepID=UPI000409E83C|nr:glycoside hydrolase domain-containing protein [Ectobacillus panaciterrae]